MKSDILRAIVWGLLGLLTIVALGVRVLTNVSYAQAAEQPQPFAQKTPAYPPPVVNESDGAQLKTVLAPYLHP